MTNKTELPKPCYGNSNGYYCTYTCEKREGCYATTNTKWGACDCEYKQCCHLWRQEIQAEIKASRESYECDFKKYFKDAKLPTVNIPNGIVKMQPIEKDI